MTSTPTFALSAACNAASLVGEPSRMMIASEYVDNNSDRISSLVLLGLIGATHQRESTDTSATANSGPLGMTNDTLLLMNVIIQCEKQTIKHVLNVIGE